MEVSAYGVWVFLRNNVYCLSITMHSRNKLVFLLKEKENLLYYWYGVLSSTRGRPKDYIETIF